MFFNTAAFFPKTVLKFNPFSPYSMDAFVKSYLFASHPFHLNDLMDGRSYTIDMRGITSELYYEIKQQIIKQAPLIINGALFNRLEFDLDKDCNLLQKAICDSFFCFGGIVSLTTQNRFSELMWSHYTNEIGYMVEYDTNRLINSIEHSPQNASIFNQIFLCPVQYKDHPISASCLLHPNIQYINIFNTTQKNKEWSYEKEWRLIATSYPFLGLPKSHKTDDKYTDVSKRKLYYNSDAIKRVYLGKKFWDSEYVKGESELEKNRRVYLIADGLIPFIQSLCKCKGEIYMSGCCDCSEFRHGTDSCACNTKTKECDFSPKSYYITRSFEQIKNIEIKGNMVTVEYDCIHRTKDEHFEQDY